MFKVGDYVTRKKYGNDIVFKIKEIKDDTVILCGVDLRLYADSSYDDLVLSTISKKKEEIEVVRKINTNDFFFIPGTIVQIDSDKEYLLKCLNYYKKNKLKCNGYIFEEKNYKNEVIKIIEKNKPKIVVITGHDAYYKKEDKYRNSKYYIETVNEIRKKYNNEIIVIAGACQSDFEGLIKAGSTYASSPKHINVHALDPAIIATYIALTNITETVDLREILSKTKSGFGGFGGIKTFGTMLSGFPRKE